MLNENFRDMLSALCEAGADYLLVGAYAMAAYGCPRATGDIDIWVRPTKDNARRVWAALEKFGAPLSKVTPEDFCTSEIVYQMGVPPQRIDILTSISGVDFEDAWPDRMSVSIDALSVPVIGLRHLHANKVASGRDKDRQDATILKELIG
ncbi:MAG: nucleotidyltransferase family protein [Planctomycetaceae bacterium]|nr:nucleotidyltransferase family protein [Planctomycetaceae bacterium]